MIFSVLGGRMFERELYLPHIAQEKSVFLLGPRQTGKSALLRAQFPQALYIDLLSPALFRQLTAHSENLEQITGENWRYRDDLKLEFKARFALSSAW